MNQEIRKLDKLNQTQNGVFHPNGLEIVSNSEVWDIRTFHLLKTVSGLDDCKARTIIFHVIMGRVYVAHFRICSRSSLPTLVK